nr:hypothetical protein [Tanacetum cinerariifolium]
MHTADPLPLLRYGLDAPPAQAGLSDGYDQTIEEANQASNSVLQSGIMPIGLAASGNLFSRVLNTSLVVRSEPERISDHLEDRVSHAALAFNSQGEHSEGKPALAFSTPIGISLGGTF